MLPKKYEDDLIIFVDRRFFVNTYVLVKDSECVVIDPGLNVSKIRTFISTRNLTVIGIILTHGHYDHIGDTFTLASECNVKVLIHILEKQIAEKFNYAKDMHMIEDIQSELISYFDSATLTIGKFNFDVLVLSGHTPGSIVLKYHNYVFSGDTIFYDSIGRTDLIFGDQEKMSKSIEKFLNYFSDDNLILPGHGRNGFLKELKHDNNYLK